MLCFVCTGPIQQNGLDPTKSEIQKLQNHIQQLEYNVKAMATVSLAMGFAASANIAGILSFLIQISEEVKVVQTATDCWLL